MQKKVMVVDDSKSIGQVMQMILENKGYTVQLCLSGREALDKFGTFLPDLIFLDIEMPVMDGFVTLEKMKSQFTIMKHKCPIVMLSGKQGTDDVMRSIKNGASDYIVKPADQAALDEKLKKHLGD